MSDGGLRDLLSARLDPPTGPGVGASRRPGSGSWVEPRSEERAAAVVLLLRPRAAGDRPGPTGSDPDGPPGPERAEALFVRRAERPGDPWSGHVSLPGGHREPGDPDLLATARRELEEETSLRIGRDDFLGRLPAIRPRSRRLPPVAVTPFVAWGAFGAEVRESEELTDHFWIPVPALADEERRSVLSFRRNRAFRAFPTVEYRGSTIWGLTFAIVRRTLALLEETP